MTAIRELKALCEKKASGEYIAASDSVEVHIYLQSGRLAWGTSSRTPTSFRDHLAAQCGISAETLNELVSECRRARTPLGEAFIARGLLNRAQVTQALKAQVVAAVGSLEASDARTMFLPRPSSYAEYDAALTFGLGDVLADPALPPKVRGPSAPELVSQLLHEAPWLQWVEYVSQTGARTRSPKGGVGVDDRMAALTLGAGADLVVLRRTDETMLGVALDDGTLWAALDAPARLGQATPAFSRLSSRPTPAPFAMQPELEVVGQSCVSFESARAAIEQDGEILAAGVVGSGSCGAALIGRKGLPLAAMLDRGLSRQRLFSSGLTGNIFSGPLVALREAPGWWFGTPMPSHLDTTVWVMSDRTIAPGLGWAVLRSLARRWENEQR